MAGISGQQGMDLLTSFGPSLLAGLLGSQNNKVDKSARARNDLANLLEVNQGASQYGGQVAQQQFGNLFDTRQTMGTNAVNDAARPYDLMGASSNARLRGAIGPQLQNFFGVSGLNLPSSLFDIDNRMGSDEFLAERLNQLGEGMSMRSPLSTPLNLGSMAGQAGARLQGGLGGFANDRRQEFTRGETDLNKSLMNAVAGYQGAANDYTSGMKNLQSQEAQKSGGGSMWKKLLGIGALAAMPFTGGLSGALAGATGLGSAAAAGLVGGGLGAASSYGAGSNPLLGAIMGGAGGSLFGPGGKYGKPSVASPQGQVNKVENQIYPKTGSRNALSSLYGG